MAHPPLVEFKNVTVDHGAFRGLHDLSLAIHSGEHTAIVGPNGSGKSTLLKVLMRECYPRLLDPPPMVRILGRESWRLFDLRAILGIVTNDLAEMTAMSSGEVRRAVVARALVNDPQAIVLDEPSNSLDVHAARELRRTLRRLAQSGITIILVTHHLPDIIPEIGRVVCLKRGRVFTDGPKDEILRAETLTSLFDTPVDVMETSGYYHMW